jgi:uncharacterized membrane protein
MENTQPETPPHKHHFRFHAPHIHLHSPFGGSDFGLKAEKFARFFGTPFFLIIQSVVVGIWIVFNIVVHFMGLTKLEFDPYPFILLNLAFSTQAAYAAPLILLAQTRQSDRDKALADADAQHREDLATAAADRQNVAAKQQEQMLRLIEQNTQLTELTRELTQRIEALTAEMHVKMLKMP